METQNGQFHPKSSFFGQEKVSWEMIIFFSFVSALFVHCLQGLSLISIASEMFCKKNYIQSNLDLIDLCNVVVGLHFENESRLGISWLRKRPIEDLVCWPNVGLLAQRIKLQLVQAILRKENTWWDMTLHILFLSFFYKVYKALRNFFKDLSDSGLII